ncbi:DUF4139 domain-containing protein, partial [Streptomyces longispororuber]|uniref:DUF4139 domain-containing protein n=1 Tax=Streptomyces longispororuber TaxID=68230 RepID=UPI00210C45BC
MTDDAAKQPWASELTSVVVYARGAVCVRLARGGVPGDGRVRVSGLPRVLEPGSLRARVVGSSGVRVTEARVVVDAEPAAPDAPLDLLREVESLRERQAAVEARRGRQARRIDEVAALRPVPPTRKRDDPHRRTPVDAWLGLAEFVDGRLTALHAGLVELDEELRMVTHELDIATDRLERASTDRPSAPVRTTVSAVLTLDGAAEAHAEVEIEYRVPGAIWLPSYRLTHRQDGGGGQLVLRASVAQRTGEDWTGVRIGLSTADLRRPTGVPRLHSVRIGRRQPVPAPSGWREPPAGLGALFAGYEAAGPRPSTPRRGGPDSVGSAYGYAEEAEEASGPAYGAPAPGH